MTAPARSSRGRVDVDDGLDECLRSFLRHVVTDAVQDPVRMLAGEFALVAFAVLGRTVEVAGEGDGRNGDGRTLEELLLHLFILRLASGQTLPPAIVVDPDVLDMRIVEGRRRAVVGGGVG